MKLEFKGTVTTGDGCRSFDDEPAGAIRIEGRDIVDEIAEAKWSDSVRVLLDGEELANGTAVASLGWGYSEWTPMEDDSVHIGECDLIERLEAMEGESVELVIEDASPTN